jgi:hypothetical protein
MPTWGPQITPAQRLDQLKLVYDYIKFHIGLYLATPTVFAIIARSFNVEASGCFQGGLIVMILLYGIAGISAGLFMGRHVNRPWQDDYLHQFEREAFESSRRFIHHSLYWIGLVLGLIGLIFAVLAKRGLVACLGFCL